MTSDEFAVDQISRAIADAIARRDVSGVAGYLAPGFTYRGDGGATVSDATAFLAALARIPGEVVGIRLDTVAIDVFGDAASAIGVQHAQVRIDGRIIDDRRSFADFFVRIGGAWKLRVAADFPAQA